MNKEEKKKKRWNRIWNDKYPFKACATGHYPLRQYCYWKSLFPMLIC